MYNVSKERYLNTWSAQSPAVFEFLPAGFQVGIGAYSHSKGTYNGFPFDPRHVRLGEHDSEGRYCSLHLEHEGTGLLLEYFKPDAWTLRGRVRREKKGEWGLRFWTLLTAGFPREGRVEYGPEGTILFRYRSYVIALAIPADTVSKCIHKERDYLSDRFQHNGYYAPLCEEPDGTWFSCGYHFDELEEINFSVAIAMEDGEAVRRAREAIALDESQLQHVREGQKNRLSMRGKYSECAEAIQSVMAWNSVVDDKHQRVYTSLTRAWIDSKFGGWFVWLNDMVLHSLILSWGGDWQMAQNNLSAALDNLTPDNNLAAMMSEFSEWVDRSQLPMISFMTLKYCEITGDIAFVRKIYGTLCDEYRWWWNNRDGNGNGILELGSSLGGHGHFKRSIQAAKDESGMDNSPIYDSAVFIPEASTMNVEDVSLNSFLCLTSESLAILADKLGEKEDAIAFQADNKILRKRFDDGLWDEKNEIYANKHWDNGFLSPGPTSFYTMVAGIPGEDRAKRLVEHIFDPDEFWTEAPLPSIWKKDPVIQDQIYFRGRTWPPLNYYVYMGLKRYGYDREAHILAEKSAAIFTKCWKEEGACYENYSPFDGTGKSTDSDPFYSWGALMPLMWINEFMDCDPWNGLHFGSVAGDEIRLDHIRLSDGIYDLDCGRETRLYRNGKLIFASDARGRFRNFRYDGHYACVKIPPQETACTVSFPEADVIRVCQNGKEEPAGTAISVPSDREVFLEIWF